MAKRRTANKKTTNIPEPVQKAISFEPVPAQDASTEEPCCNNGHCRSKVNLMKIPTTGGKTIIYICKACFERQATAPRLVS